MTNMSYFESIGILGWGNIEGIILASILSKKAILLNGPHGSNKTEGCEIITDAVFGPEAKFVPYDTSLVNADDLLGYPNPKAMSEGRIEFIETPDCIWSANACLLDEINRCNPYNAAKFFEIVRSRTINGRPTALQFVWAACNPPDKYNTSHMDAAQVSRFVVLKVPSFHDLNEKERKNVLSLMPDKEPGAFVGKMGQARNSVVPDAQERAIKKKILKISGALLKKDIQFSGRQTKDLYNLFMNMDRISRSFEGICFDLDVMATAVMSLVPECTGLIRSNVNFKNIEAEVYNLLHGFKLSDPILTADGIVDLCRASVKDAHGHAAAIKDRLEQETDTEKISEAWDVVKNRIDITPDVFEQIRQTFAAKATVLSLKKEAKVEEAAEVLAQKLQDYGPQIKKKAKVKRKKGANK